MIYNLKNKIKELNLLKLILEFGGWEKRGFCCEIILLKVF